MTMLVEFLRARLDERERVARAATGGAWTAFGIVVEAEDRVEVVYPGRDEGGADTEATATHIALNDPARVLAEVEAIRRILDEHHPIDPCDAHDASMRSIDCDTLCLLALPDAGHPDYLAEWAP